MWNNSTKIWVYSLSKEGLKRVSNLLIIVNKISSHSTVTGFTPEKFYFLHISWYWSTCFNESEISSFQETNQEVKMLLSSRLYGHAVTVYKTQSYSEQNVSKQMAATYQQSLNVSNLLD